MKMEKALLLILAAVLIFSCECGPELIKPTIGDCASESESPPHPDPPGHKSDAPPNCPPYSPPQLNVFDAETGLPIACCTSVKINGTLVAEFGSLDAPCNDEWSISLPVSSGPNLIHVSHPGYSDWEESIIASPIGDCWEKDFPDLEIYLEPLSPQPSSIECPSFSTPPPEPLEPSEIDPICAFLGAPRPSYIRVFDAETGLPITCDTTIKVGDNIMTLDPTLEPCENAVISFPLAVKRGANLITVSKPGYNDWQKSMTATSDLCGLYRIPDLEVYLKPLS